MTSQFKTFLVFTAIYLIAFIVIIMDIYVWRP